MIALRTVAEVTAACGDDPLVVWGAQDLRPGVLAWADGDAVVVAAPQLSRRDRLVVAGGPADAARLVRTVLSEVGPTFRPVGDAPLIMAVAGTVPGLEVAGRFGWMDVATPGAATPAPAAQRPTTSGPAAQRSTGPRPAGHCSAVPSGPRWLDDSELGEVDELLDEAFPASYARPGGVGVRRWAGLRDAGGPLLAVAADAWSVRRVAFVAGVATRPGARGRGRAAEICGFVVRDLLRRHGRVALFVDDWNTAAIALYRRLGFRMRAVAAARVS